MSELRPQRIVRLERDAVVVLDQRRLPGEEIELRCGRATEVADAIRVLAVRGAPAIGIAAAYGLALAAERGEDLDAAFETLAASRPTAVNLRWALEAMRDDPTRERAERHPRRRGRPVPSDVRARCRAVPGGRACAHALQRGRPRDRRLRNGARRRPRSLRRGSRGARVGRRDAAAAPGRSPHCLGARAARHPTRGDRRRRGGVVHGTRARSISSSPARTGSPRTATPPTRSARTASPCSPRTTGCRSSSSRPSSTLDPLARTGADIPIEERDPAEVSERFTARNPAFDVTPSSLVAAIVTERGVHRAPYDESLPREAAAAR